MEKIKTKNKICIEPFDDDMRNQVTALHLKNQFKHKGFNRREAFIKVVQDKTNEFADYESVKRLEQFWAGRVKDENLNYKLDGVLNNLEHE